MRTMSDDRRACSCGGKAEGDQEVFHKPDRNEVGQAMAEKMDPSVLPDRITAWEDLARQAVREYEALKARIAAQAEGEPSEAERLANELRAEGWEDTGTPPAGPPSAAERLLWLIASYNATRGIRRG